ALDGVADALRDFLATGPLLDLTLTGGAFHLEPGGPPVAFDLVVRKDRAKARGELTMRGAGAATLVLAADLEASGAETRLSATGRGSVAVFDAWLPAESPAALAARALELQATARVEGAGVLQGRTHLALGDAADVAVEALVRGGVAELSGGRAEVDLGFAATVAGLPKGVAGRVALADLTGRWPPDADARATMTATFALPRVVLPPALSGVDVVAEGVSGRLAVRPAPAGSA